MYNATCASVGWGEDGGVTDLWMNSVREIAHIRSTTACTRSRAGSGAGTAASVPDKRASPERKRTSPADAGASSASDELSSEVWGKKRQRRET